MIGCSQGSVSRWLQLAAKGRDGLGSKAHPGRKRFLTAEQEHELGQLLAQGATAHGWPNDLWTCPRVKAVIERHFGIDYHVDHVRKILVQRLGWTSQRPERRGRERKEEEIEAWRTVDFRRLKKTLRRGERP